MKLADLMTTPPITVREDTSLDQLAAQMIRHRIGCLPVVTSRGECVGIVTASDFGAKAGDCPFPPFCAPGLPGEPRRAAHQATGSATSAMRAARQIMTPRPVTLDEGASVVEAIARMLHLGFDHIPVVRDEIPVGIIARTDLLRFALRLLTGDPRTVGRERVKVGPRPWATAEDGSGAHPQTRGSDSRDRLAGAGDGAGRARNPFGIEGE